MYDLGGELRFVGLAHPPSHRAGWLVDRNGSFAGDSGALIAQPATYAGRLLGQSASDSIKSALADPAYSDHAIHQLSELHRFDAATVEALLEGGDLLADAQFVDLRRYRDGALMVRGEDVIHVSRHGGLAAIEHYGWDFETAVALNAIRLPAAFPDDREVVLRHIPLTLAQEKAPPFFLCHDGKQCFFRTSVAHPKVRTVEQGIAYFPGRNLVFHGSDDPQWVRGIVQRVMAQYLALLLQLSGPERMALTTKPEGVAIILAGRDGGRHFGHAIIDEMQALDRMLEVEAKGPPPRVYYSTTQGGSDLYGSIEELYPELADRTAAVETPIALLRAALADATQPVHVSGRLALQATRDRIQRAAARDAEASGLEEAAVSVIAPDGERRPVIAFGLRLTNRRPVDFLGFYVRLAQALTEELGPIIVVFDGINASSPGGEAAARLYSSGAIIGQSISAGSSEIATELAFVEDFIREVAELPITVVNCVATPIRHNLFWLSRCDFTVSPLGAGLAKSRWASDVPGYVFASRANLSFCSAFNIYSSDVWMEGPFTALHYNAPDDVLDEGDAEREYPDSFIPWPVNFTFRDEAKIISEIVSLLGKNLPTGVAQKRSAIA
ncbi:hypothetical protein [Methylorubrum thiocyanatum]|nr:hypothetical protein [Methylorubrum thiocyanatum]